MRWFRRAIGLEDIRRVLLWNHAEAAWCRRTLAVTATGHCFPLCRHRRAHPFHPPHTWRGV